MTTTEPRTLAACLFAAAEEALANGGPFARAIRAELIEEQAVLAWACPTLPTPRQPGTLPWRTPCLIDALKDQGARYQREGLSVSAGDCYWLAAKLTAGELLLTTADAFNLAREEAELISQWRTQEAAAAGRR